MKAVDLCNETEGISRRKTMCSEYCENLNADPTRNQGRDERKKKMLARFEEREGCRFCEGM